MHCFKLRFAYTSKIYAITFTHQFNNLGILTLLSVYSINCPFIIRIIVITIYYYYKFLGVIIK